MSPGGVKTMDTDSPAVSSGEKRAREEAAAAAADGTPAKKMDVSES